MTRTTSITALAVAVALGASVASAPQASALTAVNNGSVTWSIKDSLMSYLASPIANGKVTATDGAVAKGGKLHLPVSTSANITAERTLIPLKGKIDIKAHPGLGPTGYGLDLQYSDFAVKITGTKGELLADFTMSGATGKGFGADVLNANGNDVVLATFDLDKPINSIDSLDAPNMAMKAGQGAADSLLRYEVGEQLSPANIQINTEKNTTPVASSLEEFQAGPAGSLYNLFSEGLSRFFSVIINLLKGLGIQPPTASGSKGSSH